MVQANQYVCIGMLIIYAVTLIILCYAVKTYLIDREKYKQVYSLLFYVFSIGMIAATVPDLLLFYTDTKPPDNDKK